jgi:hypothetical protein
MRIRAGLAAVLRTGARTDASQLGADAARVQQLSQQQLPAQRGDLQEPLADIPSPSSASESLVPLDLSRCGQS